MPVELMPFQIIQPQVSAERDIYLFVYLFIYLFIACPQSLFSAFALSSMFEGSGTHELCQSLIRTKHFSGLEILFSRHYFPEVSAKFCTCSFLTPCYILAATSYE